jgi:hypothetical protein
MMVGCWHFLPVEVIPDTALAVAVEVAVEVAAELAIELAIELVVDVISDVFERAEAMGLPCLFLEVFAYGVRDATAPGALGLRGAPLSGSADRVVLSHDVWPRRRRISAIHALM